MPKLKTCCGGERMSIGRITEYSCDECAHNDICKLKGNFSKLRQQTHVLSNLLENQNFQIVTYCDYYQKTEPIFFSDEFIY